MRSLLILAVVAVPAIAQDPVVRIANASRFASNDFQIGDRYEILIAGAAGQPVSVRTTVKGQTNWGPVIGRTDSTGRWATTGQFEKSDFGDWSEVWTVGGKLANPVIHFWVGAPCLKGGQSFQGQSGPNMFLACETAAGRQTFVTLADAGPFRTPDGRTVPGRIQSDMTAEQYRAEILQYLITSGGKEMGAIPLQSSRGGLGDEAADIILSLIGVNALSEDETRNVLSIVRGVFEKPESIPLPARDPFRTLLLLRRLADSTDQESLKQQIAATVAYVQAH